MDEVTINRAWWEYLAPKRIIKKRREVEALLNSFVRSSAYGREWLKVARQPGGVFRIRPGQVIPEIKLVFLGDSPGFVAPQQKMRVGHRTVGGSDTFESRKSLAEDELAFEPSILVDLVTDPVFFHAARNRITDIDESAVKEPSQVFSIPARMLLSPQHFPKKAYVLYQHIFGAGGSYPTDGYFYVGVTTRSWQKRWSEHKRSIQGGSSLRFHRKYREEQEGGRISYVHHKVMAITDNLEELYDLEEYLVDGHWDDKRRLNMIPGGKSGLKYLRENGLLSRTMIPMPDDRDRIVSEWMKEHPRKGLPAPWVSEKWQDDNWAVAQICGRDGRLSVEQVRAIRELARKHTAEEIFERIGAKNVEQVKRVLDGKTYTRVK